jgi:hypothetical protein
LKYGVTSQLSGIQRGSILRKAASLPFVHSQICLRSPHSARRCRRVSICSQLGQCGEAVNSFFFLRSFVAIMSCITSNHVDLTFSSSHPLCRFPYTVAQGMSGYLCLMRIIGAGEPAAICFRKVSYSPLFNLR